MSDYEHRTEAIYQIFGMEGWEVLKSFLTQMRESDMDALASMAERKFPDDFYRGRLEVITWLLEGLPMQVEEARQNQAQKAQDMAGQPRYEATGHPYGPEEGQPFLEGEDQG